MLKAKDLMNNARDSFAAGFAEAIKNGDDKALADVIATFSEDVQQALMEEHNDLVSSTNDAAVLAARGTRVLTSAETKYYNALIEAMKSDKPQAAITGIKETLPETIIDAVLDDIEAQFPLLDAIDFRNTTGITKWPYNKKGLQYAVWGPLGSKIIEELSGDIGALSIEQCKLTAFMAVSKDWTKWDGVSEIDAEAAKVITIVECDGNYKAVASGKVTAV